MTTNSSLEFFTRLVVEKHNALKASSQDLVLTIAREHLPAKYAASEHTHQAGLALSNSLASGDRPGWLTITINYTAEFNRKAWTTSEFLVNFLPFKEQLEHHKWQFDLPADNAFNFDAIFEKYRRESQIPKLFDEIIVWLDAIKASGEIDSKKMHDALGRIIATVKIGKVGSYPALSGSWQFLVTFLKNFLWAELSKIPVLGTLTDSLRKTIEETSKAMDKLNTDMREAVARTAIEAGIALNADTILPFVGYDQTGKLA